jgi:hypothetical protein
MYKRMLSCISVVLVALILVGSVFADDSQMKEEQGMPQVGPAPQMKQLDFLLGTWDVAMKSRFNPSDTAWVETKGTAKYENILDGCIQKSSYESSMMGLPFEGLMLEGYNTDLKKWQAVWMDNTGGGRMSLYTGSEEGDSTVLAGSEVYMGQQVYTRIVMYDMTPTSFNWKMETSPDGGKTLVVFATAVYTKRK